MDMRIGFLLYDSQRRKGSRTAERTKNAPDETESEKQYREWKVYGLSGLMLSLTTLTLQGVIILIVKDGSVFAYGGTLILPSPHMTSTV